MKFLRVFVIFLCAVGVLFAKGNSTGAYAHVKLTQVLSGKHNKYDTTTGSAYYINVGYKTKSYKGFSLNVSGYTVGDLGFTKTGKDDYVSNGVFMGKKTKDKSTVLESKQAILDLHIDYKSPLFKLRIGHFKFNTPMTKIASSTVPNMYEGVVFQTNKLFKGSTFVASFINKMAYGARAISDWSKISEKTGSAGAIAVNSVDKKDIVANSVASDQFLPKSNVIRRGKYTNIGIISGFNKKTDGLAVVGFIKKTKGQTIQVWDYYADEVANVIYADITKKLSLNKNTKLMLGAQVLYQDIKGLDKNPTLWGAKVGIKYKNMFFNLAGNKNNSYQILNTWGGDPGYTSTKLSRNEYRPDVKAYKAEFKYVGKPMPVMPKTIFKVAYAKYKKSSLAHTQKDATERDIVVKFKINKKLTIGFSNVLRTTEFDGYKGKDRTQNYTNMAVVYKF